MKTTIQQRNAGLETRSARGRVGGGFTLIELLVVIAIITILASLTITVIHGVSITKYRNVARAELHEIMTAVDAYQKQYGVYPPGNANPTGTYTAPMDRSMFSQLYYELDGVNNKVSSYACLDGVTTIAAPTDVQKAFGVGGFGNCSKGSGDDTIPARNFLLDLKPNQVAYVTNNTVLVTLLVTSVRGPDSTYQPLAAPDVNPFRYVYPGVHNPNGYDLWVNLVINGKTNLICNWNSATLINSGLP